MRLSFSKYVKNYIYTFINLLFVQQKVDFHLNRVLDLYTCRLNIGQTSSSLFDQSFHWYKDAIIFLLIGSNDNYTFINLLFVQQTVDFHSKRVLDVYITRLNFGQTSSS